MAVGTPAPTLGLDELRRGARALTEKRREARRDYVRYCEQEADADRDYRRTMARSFTRLRSGGEPVGAAEIIARADAADAKHRRDIAASLAKASLLKIEELERDSATLRSISTWSMKIDGVEA